MAVKNLKYLLLFISDIMYIICLLPDSDIQNTWYNIDISYDLDT